MPALANSLTFPRARAALIALACLGPACDEEPEPDPYAERVRADIEACQAALLELAHCGPEPECFPNVSMDIPFSLEVLAGCAISACAAESPEEVDQCRYEVATIPGPTCAAARSLCEFGDLEDSWAALDGAASG
ncbi:hypothetical protein PPSIR1_01652 [Plesiocystis pacifica SIR-1]|uniref:Uncharacterized protein n=1 Tax=Plesiocystis pacifica SIR-1 TaxID=391625 RepID=A6G8I1_9BACT|nr:hypothetical protein [Plesiocystis pacifica]EDM77891.1 hypothetical protein PPSIR1_01652 [Plesiocystis pacifica SIR-1]